MKVWLLFIFGIVPIISQAQNRMISGEVTDKEYNPIEFVTISLLSANDSSLIAGTITNEKGNSHFHVKKKGLHCPRISYRIHYNLHCRRSIYKQYDIHTGALHYQHGGDNNKKQFHQARVRPDNRKYERKSRSERKNYKRGIGNVARYHKHER